MEESFKSFKLDHKEKRPKYNNKNKNNINKDKPHYTSETLPLIPLNNQLLTFSLKSEKLRALN